MLMFMAMEWLRGGFRIRLCNRIKLRLYHFYLILYYIDIINKMKESINIINICPTRQNYHLCVLTF